MEEVNGGKKKGTSVIGSTIKINLKKREGDADLTPTIGKCVCGGEGEQDWAEEASDWYVDLTKSWPV